MSKPLTEDQIERRVELAIDALEIRFMNGDIDQLQYDLEVYRIDKWANQQYSRTYR